jgi:hypothetical protein
MSRHMGMADGFRQSGVGGIGFVGWAKSFAER